MLCVGKDEALYIIYIHALYYRTIGIFISNTEHLDRFYLLRCRFLDSVKSNGKLVNSLLGDISNATQTHSDGSVLLRKQICH